MLHLFIGAKEVLNENITSKKMIQFGFVNKNLKQEMVL